MAVRSTYSSGTALADILAALSPLSSLATEATVGEQLPVLDEIKDELKRTRLGHQVHLWGEDTEGLDTEEDD